LSPTVDEIAQLLHAAKFFDVDPVPSNGVGGRAMEELAGSLLDVGGWPSSAEILWTVTETAALQTAAFAVSLPWSLLVAGVYALCALVPIGFFVGDIVLTDKDPNRSGGPIASIIGVASFGTAALVIGVGLALWLVRTPERARSARWSSACSPWSPWSSSGPAPPGSSARAPPGWPASPAAASACPARRASPASSGRSSCCSTWS